MTRHTIEVFTAGCPLCDQAVKTIKELACGECDVRVYDLREGCATNECREKAENYGIHRVPAVAVDGALLECCRSQGPISREALLAAGIGRA